MLPYADPIFWAVELEHFRVIKTSSRSGGHNESEMEENVHLWTKKWEDEEDTYININTGSLKVSIGANRFSLVTIRKNSFPSLYHLREYKVSEPSWKSQRNVSQLPTIAVSGMVTFSSSNPLTKSSAPSEEKFKGRKYT